MLANVKNVVEDSFDNLSRAIELPFYSFSTISRCQALIEKRLTHEIPAFASVLPGAIARHTMVSSLTGSRIDMLLLFNHQYRSTFLPGALLETIRRLLIDEYAQTVFERPSMSLIVPIEDITFRLQPGFITEHNHYLIPAPGWDDWVEYDVIGYKHQFARANANHAGKLVAIVRIIKMWNKLNGSMFDGYYLELIIKDALEGYTIEDTATALNRIFRLMVTLMVYKKDDPANPGLQVEGLRDVEQLVEAMLHIHNTYKQTQQALTLQSDGSIKQAHTIWEALFPGYFPAFAIESQ